eukprot:5484785-Pyramimonas_sp.AAC.2
MCVPPDPGRRRLRATAPMESAAKIKAGIRGKCRLETFIPHICRSTLGRGSSFAPGKSASAARPASRTRYNDQQLATRRRRNA